VDANGANRQAFFDLYNTGRFLVAEKREVRPAFFALDRKNFAPRAGLAWGFAKKTVVRSGFGKFYAGLPDCK